MEQGVFINFSNHASANWEKAQLEAAEKYGKVVDVPFPAVDPSWDREQVVELAADCAGKILDKNPAAVMCQGEFGLTYEVVRVLQEKGIPALYACSTREVVESRREDGAVKKEAVFRFVRFRRY